MYFNKRKHRNKETKRERENGCKLIEDENKLKDSYTILIRRNHYSLKTDLSSVFNCEDFFVY